MLNQRSDKVELLRIAESVATEKSIDKEIVINSMESAIQKAAYSKFGFDNEIEATIDRDKGSIKIQKVLQVVEKVEDSAREISLKDASLLDKKNKNLKMKRKVKNRSLIKTRLLHLKTNLSKKTKANPQKRILRS